MAYGYRSDAYDGILHRSLRQQILESVPPGEEFRPLRFFYLRWWQRSSLCSIPVSERPPGMSRFVINKLAGSVIVGLLQRKGIFIE